MTADVQEQIRKLRQDAETIDRAADVLYQRGSLRLGERLRAKAREWMEQSDEMERRA